MFCVEKGANLLTLPITNITEINLQLAQYLLENRLTDIDALIDDKHLPIREPTLLHVAVWNSDEQLFNYLISKGANIDKSFETYGSALHVAVFKATESLKIIDRLIERGAPINQFEFLRQWTPLHMACYLGRDDIVILLLRRGADINPTISNGNQILKFPGNTPLHVAIQYNQVRIVNLLCKLKANINAVSVHQGTPLISAVAGQNYKITEMLINQGADVDFICTISRSAFENFMLDPCGSFELTALHLAVLLQDEDMVEILLRHGAAIDVSIEKFKTPLYQAVIGTNSNIVSLLLNAGAGLRIANSERSFIQKQIRARHQGISQLK